MATKSKTQTVCFVCLKPFQNADRQRQSPRRSTTSQKTRREKENDTVDYSTLFQKFSRILTDYLQLSAADLQQLSSPKASVFCTSCSETINTICDVYNELRLVELRLSSKLGELGELMMVKPKLGALVNQLLLRQEEGTGSSSYVEKLRNLVAFKCATKGREVELHRDLLVDKNERHEGGGRYSDGDDDAEEDCEEDTLPRVKVKVEITNSDDDYDYEAEDDFVPDLDDELLDDKDKIEPDEPQATSSQRATKRSEDRCNTLKNEKAKDSEEVELIQTDSDCEWSDDAEIDKKKRSPKKAKTMKRIGTTTTGPPGGSKRKKLDNEGTNSSCQLCNKSFKGSEFGKHLYIHEMNVKETDKKIQCNFCHSAFAFPQTFEYHLKIRHGETKLVFPCEEDECESSFDSVDDLNSHLKTHSSEIHLCSTCNWGFLNVNMKDLHELSHLRSVRGNYPCSKCGRVLHGFPKFRDHYNLRHGAKLKNHKCSKCNLTFLSRTNLRTHEKKHEKGTLGQVLHPPQCCEVCGRIYEGSRAQELLDRHMKNKHVGEKELSCNICDTPFEFDRHLDKHLKTEHGLEKIPCPKCNKTLGSTRTLREHMRIVHADEPEQHLCPHCGSVYKDFRYLQRHILMQHPDLIIDEGKFDCSDCGKKFRRKIMVKRHLKTCPGKREEMSLPVDVNDVESENETKSELSYNNQDNCSSVLVM
ncbi:unnamed protein product [Orchesella dallaii]|uniref:C2H2-type domain-containing protein n=1 Tax=Orchesella dallaii TaxID=48710 RepID=A0ABP1RHL3_9HEXA